MSSVSSPEEFPPHLPLRRESGRKLFHLVGLVLPIGYVVLGAEVARLLILIAVAIVLGADAARLFWTPARRVYARWFAPISRASEERRLTGASMFILGQAAAAFIFPEAIAPVAMAFGVVGDTAAAVAGKAFGGREWRPGKTVSGSLGCLAASFVVGLCLANTALLVVAAGAIAATLAEGLARRVNDNLLIPICGGGVMWALVGLA